MTLRNKLGSLAQNMWRPIANRAYDRKSKEISDYSRWCEEHAKEIREHWGHEILDEPFVVKHLSSQLYEICSMLMSRLGSCKDLKVLDAGASDGMILHHLEVQDGIGLNMLDGCLQKIKSDGFLPIRGDVQQMPFPDHSFDVVLCSETVEHLSDPIKGLKELARVCKPGGRICITIPKMAKTRINSYDCSVPPGEGHIFELNHHDFLKILTHAKLRAPFWRDIVVFPQNFTLWYLRPILRRFMYPNFFPRLAYYELEINEMHPVSPLGYD